MELSGELAHCSQGSVLTRKIGNVQGLCCGYDISIWDMHCVWVITLTVDCPSSSLQCGTLCAVSGLVVLQLGKRRDGGCAVPPGLQPSTLCLRLWPGQRQEREQGLSMS